MKKDNNKKALGFFKVLAHPMSDKILNLIENKRYSVTEIYNALKLEQSATSIQLNKLHNIGVLTVTKEGKKKYYEIDKKFTGIIDQSVNSILNYNKRK